MTTLSPEGQRILLGSVAKSVESRRIDILLIVSTALTSHRQYK